MLLKFFGNALAYQHIQVEWRTKKRNNTVNQVFLTPNFLLLSSKDAFFQLIDKAMEVRFLPYIVLSGTFQGVDWRRVYSLCRGKMLLFFGFTNGKVNETIKMEMGNLKLILIESALSEHSSV